MKLTDITELLDSSFEEKYDLYINGMSLPSFEELSTLSENTKTIVLLPAGLYATASDRVTVYNRNDTSFDRAPALCLADAHLMENEKFHRFIEENGYKRIIVPFAELSDEAEYGAVRGYRWVGEWRSESLSYCQVVCLFTAEENPDKYRFFYSPNVRVITFDAMKGIVPVYRTIKAENTDKKFEITYKEAVKKAGRTVAVFFSTRTDCHRFAAFCKSRGRETAVVTGESTGDEIRNAVGRIIGGKASILLCTKSALSLFPLIKCDAVLYCGAPYSFTHHLRCALFGNDGTIIWCEDDFKEAERQINIFTTTYCEGVGDEIYSKKLNALHELKSQI